MLEARSERRHRRARCRPCPPLCTRFPPSLNSMRAGCDPPLCSLRALPSVRRARPPFSGLYTCWLLPPSLRALLRSLRALPRSLDSARPECDPNTTNPNTTQPNHTQPTPKHNQPKTQPTQTRVLHDDVMNKVYSWFCIHDKPPV